MSPQHRRRSQGEGSVFRRSDGKWRGVLDLGWIDGKRTRRWVFGATEREVLAKLAELREAQRRGQNLSARRYTFGQWLDEWLSVKRRQGSRANTARVRMADPPAHPAQPWRHPAGQAHADRHPPPGGAEGRI
jgi:hypothetical protein